MQPKADTDGIPVFDHKHFLARVTERPGIYRMFGEQDLLLYVGKARNLKHRLASYFRTTGLSPKTQSLVSKIRRIEVTVTASETDALLLEQNLIKDNRPPYNILLRDDKSYPYIYVSSHETYPSITFRRGRSKKSEGHFYGPFPSALAVRESLNLLQKLFMVRQCEDSFFNNRSRPCLQYQIKRCSGPCVKLVKPEDYAQDLRHTVMFLEGKNPDIIEDLLKSMTQAAESLDFERAAALRDQIAHLRHVQAQQSIESAAGDADILAFAQEAGIVCVVLVMVRGGRVLGTKPYFPRIGLDFSAAELLSGFVGQHYLGSRSERLLPKEIILPQAIEDSVLLQTALSQLAGQQVRLTSKVRGERRRWLELAQNNANQSLQTRLTSKETAYRRLLALRELLSMAQVPVRMECFDISHSHGESTVASCVVFDENGPLKSDYRIYNIEGVTPGDDYAAMRQALTRRFRRLVAGEGKWPDLVLIDGGAGQLKIAREVFDALGIQTIKLIGVAKGVTRKAGFEVLIDAYTGSEFRAAADSPALHLIQHIRDESHRFAISGHRQRRDKKRRVSLLEGIHGIGPKRRRELLRYFGSMQGMGSASVEEIAKVKGISRAQAEIIYASLHDR